MPAAIPRTPGSTSTTCWASPTRTMVAEVLGECEPASPPMGAICSRCKQPRELPTLEDRWRFVSATLKKAPTVKIRADDRQPRVPLHLQLLHRFDGRLPAAQLPAAAVLIWRSCSPRSRTRSSAGTTRTSGSGSTNTWKRSRRGAAGPDAAHRREQSLAAVGAAPEAAAEERLPGGTCRASSPGSTWATSPRPGGPAWRRSSRSPST